MGDLLDLFCVNNARLSYNCSIKGHSNKFSHFLGTVEVQWIFDPNPSMLWPDSAWYYIELRDNAS